MVRQHSNFMLQWSATSALILEIVLIFSAFFTPYELLFIIDMLPHIGAGVNHYKKITHIDRIVRSIRNVQRLRTQVSDK